MAASAADIPQDLRIEVLQVANLGDPEYRFGDLTSGLLVGSGPSVVYVELSLGSRTVPTASVNIPRGCKNAAFWDERHLFVHRGEQDLHIQVRDKRGVQAALRGDPMIGEATVHLDLSDGLPHSEAVELVRGDRPAGVLMLQYQLCAGVESASGSARLHGGYSSDVPSEGPSKFYTPPSSPREAASSPTAGEGLVEFQIPDDVPLWVGKWKLDKSCSELFEPILSSLGVNYLLRKAADMSSSTMSISLSTTHIKCQVDSFVVMREELPLDGSEVEVSLPTGTRTRGKCRKRLTKSSTFEMEMLTDLPEGEGQLQETLTVSEDKESLVRKTVRETLEVKRVFRRVAVTV